MKSIGRLIFIGALWALAACSAKTPPASVDLFEGQPTIERRWSATLDSAGEALPLTLIFLSAPEYDGRGRLLALSAFGATLGDCALSGTKTGPCRNAPGADPLMKKSGGALARMLAENPGFLLTPGEPEKISGQAWAAERDREGRVTYRHLEGRRWTLNLEGGPARP
ncbi:MAG: hypothetical protein LBP33_04770 [Candidatus Adiutrix sp.]|jgi:hypothetical protein|nr:hypothetical protein [Candidatus Adiutrix sp.]